MQVIVLTAALALAWADPLIVDPTKHGQPLGAIGGLSGGGATTRLLVDYVEPARSQILDYLFTPNFGASLHLLKVEIGGDSQSTDGTESSHMHSKDDLNFDRGYEWWLMSEAKKRNPDITLYGLPWAFPGWVGEGSGSPFQYPNLTSDYITKWVSGAKTEYGLDIDYIGIWNERSSDATYVKTLRKTLDNAGFTNTKLIARDGTADICNDLAKDPEYAAAVHTVGLHYPSDYNDYSTCHNLDKPLWASEESSSYDDLNGAACWGRIITSHWVKSQMTGSIMWNLVGSYFHGTNWYASSMMTAVQPWSGYYEINPVIWASAHVTQFSKPGWIYLENDSGSGNLPNGGFYATLVDPNTDNVTITIVKIDHDHAPCTRPKLPDFNVSAETVTFKLTNTAITKLAYWYSNFQNYSADAPIFQRQPDMQVAADGTFTVAVPVGAMITLSTIMTGPQKGSHGVPPTSQPSVPLPWTDDFDKYPESQEAHWWSDQIGAFEIHASANVPSTSGSIMRQMVPSLPIGWSDHGSNGPVTVGGMREWQDITVNVTFSVPSTSKPAAGCVATRSDQSWFNGIVFCVYTTGNYSLSYAGPDQATGFPDSTVASGSLSKPITTGTWYTLSLTTINDKATATLDGETIVSDVTIRTGDTGFAAFGTNSWIAAEYDDVGVHQAGDDAWDPVPTCGGVTKGTTANVKPCPANGVGAPDYQLELLADWGIRHVATDLCLQASSADSGSKLVLASCDPSNTLQQLKNDYTRIRNAEVPMTLEANPSLSLVGGKDGSLTVGTSGDWSKWSFFPNTGQLRNQYTYNGGLGYPMCLSVCDS